MKIQVNTDNHIQGSDALTERVTSVLEDALKRFGNRITRVEVHLTDENSSKKSGGNDKRCMIEARLAGQKPIAVTDQSESLELSLHRATEKLEKAIERTLERESGR